MSALGGTAYPDKSTKYKIVVIVRVCVMHNANAQQTRNHFWTSWHVSYWFIIGTAPPVRVFVCIHVNTCVLPLSWFFNEFDMSRTGLELVRFQWYVRVITWKNLWFHSKQVSTHQMCSQNPVNSRTETRELSQLKLMNSLTEQVKSRVVVCWVCFDVSTIIK